MNARGIPSVQYTQINQLEGLRRMQHAQDICDIHKGAYLDTGFRCVVCGAYL